MIVAADEVVAVTRRYGVVESDARKFEFCDKVSAERGADPLDVWLRLALTGSIVISRKGVLVVVPAANTLPDEEQVEAAVEHVLKTSYRLGVLADWLAEKLDERPGWRW
jgi:hypothetical protein